MNKISILPRYWEGTDLTNSVMLKELPNLPMHNRVLISAKRYDLLSETVYGDPKFEWILRFYNGILEENLELGSYLPYPSFDDVKNLIMSLDDFTD